MYFIKPLTLIALSSSLLFSAPHAKQDPALQDVIQKGQSSSQLLLKTLGSNMKKNMKTGGPMQALDFCSQEAYNLTEKVNEDLPKGVTVKRISTKFRNPANQPQTDEELVLASLQKLQDANATLPKQIITKIDVDTYKYYKPLVIDKEVCLKCHGDVMNKELKNAISQRYPEDKAMHYKMGDLRGAVVVTVKQQTN